MSDFLTILFSFVKLVWLSLALIKGDFTWHKRSLVTPVEWQGIFCVKSSCL